MLKNIYSPKYIKKPLTFTIRKKKGYLKGQLVLWYKLGTLEFLGE